MRRTFVLTALLLSPLLASAQAAAPPAEPAPSTATAVPSAPAPAPQWSIGAGVTLILFSSGPFALSASGFSFSVPSVSASIERRLSERTWLVAGAYGSVQRFRSDLPAGSAGAARNDVRYLSLTGGVRRIVTRPAAIVEVSLLALGEAGVGDADVRQVGFSGISTSSDWTAWFAGATAGIALDRELTDGLSLRLSSPLVLARYNWSADDQVGQARAISSGFSVSAYLAPRLELRLAF